MATILPTIDASGEGAQRLLTVADLAALPLDLPSGTIDYELDNGRLVIMSPAGRQHGKSQATVAAELKIQGERRGHGDAYTDVGVILWRNPDRVVAPDVAFIRTERLPAVESPEGYLETIPDLVVEVRSKNDGPKAIVAKVEDYLRAGVRIVWVVDPLSECVNVYASKTAPATFQKTMELQLDDIIPGFQLPVSAIFQ